MSNSNSQQSLLTNFESIGDILVFDTERKKEGIVIRSLPRLERVLRRLTDLRKKDEAKFDELVLAPGIQKKGKHCYLGFESLFLADLLFGFLAGFSQFERVFEAAERSNSVLVKSHSIAAVSRLIDHWTEQDNNDDLIQHSLDYLLTISTSALMSKDQRTLLDSVYWFCNWLLKEYSADYSDLMCTHLFEVLKVVTSEERYDALQEILLSILQAPGFHIVWPATSLSEASSLINKAKLTNLAEHERLKQKILWLRKGEKHLKSRGELAEWRNSLSEVLTAVADNEFSENALRLRKNITEDATRWFKHIDVRRVLVKFGAYCLFAGQSKAIYELWQVKSPDDSTVTWIGGNLVPETITELLKLYFGGHGLVALEVLTQFKGHHGSSVYLRRYFLLLLAHLLSKESFSPEQFDDANFLPSDLDGMRSYLKQVKTLIPSVVTDKVVLSNLKFDSTDVELMIEVPLEVTIDDIIHHIDLSLDQYVKKAPLSNRKLETFDITISRAWRNARQIKSCFEHLERFIDLAKSPKNRKPSSGARQIGSRCFEPKALFIDNWHYEFDLAENIAESVASGEDTDLLNTLIENASHHDNANQLFQLLKEDGRWIILCDQAWTYFFDTAVIPDSDRISLNLLNKASTPFRGYLTMAGSEFPIYEVNLNLLYKRCLVIDRRTLGWFVQYPPEHTNFTPRTIIDGLGYSIEAFSENSDLLKKTLNNPPPFVAEKGNIDKQTDFLLEKVEVKYLEYFQYKPNWKPLRSHLINLKG